MATNTPKSRDQYEDDLSLDNSQLDDGEEVRASAFLVALGTGFKDNVIKPFLWGAAAAFGMGVGYKLFDKVYARFGGRIGSV